MRAWMPWVVAGVVLLSPTGVQAQQAPSEDGGGERVVGVEGGEVAGRGGSARVASVRSITTDEDLPANGEFTVTVVFSGTVTGFSLSGVEVTNGSTVSNSLDEVSGQSGREYEFDVEPEDDYDGPLTVRIRTNAVNEGNAAYSETFEVDTIEPKFEDATVVLDELVLEYSEEPRRGRDSQGAALRSDRGWFDSPR